MMDDEKKIGGAVDPAPRKRAGRKPAADKAAPAGKAKGGETSTTLILQFQGGEVDLSTLVEAAKADFKQEKKRTPISDLKLYVKPEERTAYYVVNEKHNGSISY